MGKPASSEPSATTDGYVAQSDDVVPITIDWCHATGEMANDTVEVRPIAVMEHFDGIEVWSVEDDGENPDGLLAVFHFPITRGDIRKLCWALNVPITT